VLLGVLDDESSWLSTSLPTMAVALAKHFSVGAHDCRCVTAVGGNFENPYFTRYCNDMLKMWWDIE